MTQEYRLVCTDRFNHVIAEMKDAQLESVTWDLNGPGDIKYTLSQSSAEILAPLEHINEMQLWVRGKLLQWGFHEDTTEKSATCDFICPGLMGYMRGRIITTASLSYGIDANHAPIGSGVEQMDIAADVWRQKSYDLNIGVAPYGPSLVMRYLFYDRWEHPNVFDDILTKFPQYQDAVGNYTGFDIDITWDADGSNRYFTMYYPAKGAQLVDVLLEFGINITDYVVAVSGSAQANVVYTSGGTNGDIRFENFALSTGDELANYGHWEIAQNVGSQNDTGALLEIAQRYLKIHKFPLKMPEITVVEVPEALLDVIHTGDYVPVKIVNGRTNIIATFRIGSITWTPGPGNLKVVLVDSNEIPDPVVPGSFRSYDLSFLLTSYGATTTFDDLEGP